MMQTNKGRLMRWVVAILSAATLLALGAQVEARAEAPSFPDLSGYTPVNVADYTIALPNPGRPKPIEGVYFITPDGIPCTIARGGEVIAGAAVCRSAQLPGIKDQGSSNAIDTTSGIGGDNVMPYVDGAIQGHKLRVLPPFHSIAVAGIICGVDDAGTTACKDAQGRGFVLSPRGSAWLPKV